MEKVKRPRITIGATTKVTTGCGNMYITTGFSENKLIEVFASLGKSGGCAKCQGEAITRCVSLGLKYGVPVEEFIKELEELRCVNPIWDTGKQVYSCPDAIAKVLGGIFDENTSNSPKPVLIEE